MRNRNGHARPDSLDRGRGSSWSGADSRGLNTLYSHKGGNADTAQIRLRGVDSNRDAIGARIEVTVSPKEGPAQTFHYSVQSSQGFQSQNSSWLNGRADGLQKSKHLVYTLLLPVILPVC